MTAPTAPPPSGGGYRTRLHVRLLAPRYWPVWVGLGFLRVLLVLPRRAWLGLGARLGDLHYALNPKRRHIATTNIRLCFPDLSPDARYALVRAHFRMATQCMLDLPWIWWARRRRIARYLRLDGVEHYQRAREAGQPVILLTCHLAGIEVGGTFLSRLFPMISLVKPVRNPVLDWFMTRSRTRFAGRLYTRRDNLRTIVRAVREGAGFYYLPDEDHGRGKDVVFVPFFGVPAATLTALGRLATLSEAVVIPFFCYLDAGGHYTLRLGAPLADFPTGDATADASRMNREIEAAVRAAPAQYLWTYRRFKTRPQGEPSPYRR